MQAAYGAIHNRLQNLVSGRDRAVQLPEPFITALLETTERLGGAIRDKKDSEIYPILARFSEICYATTGNGYYLFHKGELKI